MIEVEKKVEFNRVAFYIKGTKILHREDGPAAILPGAAKIWYCNGKRHREDGPAVIFENGTNVWYLNDKQLSKEEWFGALSEEQKKTMLYSECFINK